MELIAFPTIDLVGTGRRIESLRRARGLSVRELQTYFGFASPQAIYKWQWGESLPSVDNLLALARILRVPMDDLLVEMGQEVPPVLWGKNALYQKKQVPILPGIGAYLSGLHTRCFRICARMPFWRYPSVLALASGSGRCISSTMG